MLKLHEYTLSLAGIGFPILNSVVWFEFVSPILQLISWVMAIAVAIITFVLYCKRIKKINSEIALDKQLKEDLKKS